MVVMAGLEPATQDQRANRSATLLYEPWVAGSRFACPAMTTLENRGGAVRIDSIRCGAGSNYLFSERGGLHRFGFRDAATGLRRLRLR